MFQEQQRQESSILDDISSEFGGIGEQISRGFKAFGSLFSTEQSIEKPKSETTSIFQSFSENDAIAGSSSMKTDVRQRNREHTSSVQKSAGECATEFWEFLRPSASLQGEKKTFAPKEQSQKQGEKMIFAPKEQSSSAIKWLFNSACNLLSFVAKWLFIAMRILLFAVIDLFRNILSVIPKCKAKLVTFNKNLGIFVKMILLFVIFNVIALVVLIILALN